MPEALERVEKFRSRSFGADSFIALHVRHGNDAQTGHAAYWASFHSAIDRCERAGVRARQKVGSKAPVFLCTDSAEVQSAVRKRIPNVVCRKKEFRQPGTGELHLWDEAHRGRIDAMVEMLLLAKCDALIRYPPGSFLCRSLRNWQNGRYETVYDLHRPCDPEDPLSPTLLL